MKEYNTETQQLCVCFPINSGNFVQRLSNI